MTTDTSEKIRNTLIILKFIEKLMVFYLIIQIKDILIIILFVFIILMIG